MHRFQFVVMPHPLITMITTAALIFQKTLQKSCYTSFATVDSIAKISWSSDLDLHSWHATQVINLQLHQVPTWKNCLGSLVVRKRRVLVQVPPKKKVHNGLQFEQSWSFPVFYPEFLGKETFDSFFLLRSFGLEWCKRDWDTNLVIQDFSKHEYIRFTFHLKSIGHDMIAVRLPIEATHPHGEIGPSAFLLEEMLQEMLAVVIQNKVCFFSWETIHFTPYDDGFGF